MNDELIAGMRCPPDLQREDYLPWSRGRGVDVWAMFVAAVTGDVGTMARLVSREPALVLNRAKTCPRPGLSVSA